MRREREEIEKPVQRRALLELLVPCIPLKLIEGSETGWPDGIFLIPGGKPLFIEFKWPGKKPDPKQVYMHTLLRNLGYDVEVHDNVEEALAAIATRAEKGRREMGSPSIHEARCEMVAGKRLRGAVPRSRAR